MIIYNCTSTLHHPPIVTIIMIVLNIVVYFFSANASPDTVVDYSLWYGNGYHPVQWLTSAFLHANAAHLIGNMLFLWPFGLLVEGKMGWSRFLILYLGIAVGQNIIEQTIMLPSASEIDPAAMIDSVLQDPDFERLSDVERQEVMMLLQFQTPAIRRSLGASSVIFGLLACCIMFAPASDFNVWWRLVSIDVPVLVVGGLYLLKELFMWQQGQFGIDTAALHLLGMGTGFIAGYLALQWNAAQCDGEDIFAHFTDPYKAKQKKRKASNKKTSQPKTDSREKSRIARAKAKAEQKKAAQKEAEAKPDPPRPIAPRQPSPSKRAKSSQLSPASLIASQRYSEAVKQLQTLTDRRDLVDVAQASFKQLYQATSQGKHWGAAAITLQKWIAAHPEQADARKLQLARILVSMDRIPRAKQVLATVSIGSLSTNERRALDSLNAKILDS